MTVRPAPTSPPGTIGEVNDREQSVPHRFNLGLQIHTSLLQIDSWGLRPGLNQIFLSFYIKEMINKYGVIYVACKIPVRFSEFSKKN